MWKMFSNILEELKANFQLKKNHLTTLKLLSVEECTADEICERTTIPKGRVYNLLNELISMKLIERKKGTPAIYSMKDPQDKILDFLKYDFKKEMQKQSRILSMLEDKTRVESIEVISDDKSYDYNLISLIAQSDILKTIHRKLSISWFLQPRDVEEFWRIRQEINKRRRAATTPSREISLMKYRAYMDIYDQKPVEQIMTKDALDAYVNILEEVYGKAHVKRWAKQVIEDLEKSKNVKLFIIDATPSVFNTYISDKGVLSILIFRGEVSGMKIVGRRVVDIYEKYFEELKKTAQPIQEHLQKLI